MKFLRRPEWQAGGGLVAMLSSGSSASNYLKLGALDNR